MGKATSKAVKKPASPAPRRAGRKPAGAEPRTPFTMLLNAEERDMIAALRTHYGTDGEAATIRQAILREYRNNLD